MSKIRIASDLTLPLDAVTQAIGILAKRRAGKSYLARRLAEQFLKAEQQVVIVDPKGDWWGIRSAADGKGPGFKVTILGGEHADVPLEAGGGELVAKLIVEERVSILLDLSLFSKAQVATFMAAFLETLYRLKAQEQYRTPMMLIIDEADAIAPQKPMKGTFEERMLGAANDIVRRGGQRGIGCTMVTQRSAVLNKNVLTQIEMLITLKTIAPQDLAAINEWVDVHGTKEQRLTLMETLPALPVGTAWFWSPSWPTDKGVFQKSMVLPIETFDSGATPKPGQKQAKPKTMADVDLDAFRKRMAATMEKAKQEDPKELRKLIAELKREAKTKPAPVAVVKAPKVVKVEVPVLSASDRKLLDRAETAARVGSAKAQDMYDALTKLSDRVAKATAVVPTLPVDPAFVRAFNAPLTNGQKAAAHFAAKDRAEGVKRVVDGKHIVKVPVTHPRPRFTASGSPEVGRSGLRRILVALAQRPDGLTNRQIGIRAGISSRSGSFSTYMSTGRTNGWIVDAGPVRTITEAGLAALGNYEPLPTGAALLEHWLRELGESGASRILRVLSEAYPDPLDNDAIGERASISARSGSFSTYMSKLRGLELIEGTRGQVRASAELFS
jgi:hypothetical protein